ncbi:MAG TPA: efflux transporter outer membrane subunit [Verrucomicrobiae bacterium]
MRKIYWSMAMTAALLTGCTMTPKYERPAAPVAGTWPASVTATNGVSTVAAELAWQDFFQDARLKQVIGLALANNRDLRVAALNVEISRAQYRIQRADLLPTADAGAAFTRQRTAATAFSGPTIGNQYSVSGVASYELDLFGRVRSLKSQALERFFATEEARRSAHIALIGEVALQYLNHQSLMEQVKLAEQTLKTVTDSLNLTQKRFELGDTSQLDVRSAESLVQRSRASLAAYQQQLAQAENALTFLVGAPLPADLPPQTPLNDKGAMAEVSAGMPADLLQRRPDILAAEHELKAANANIGAARAAFFPRILLTAGGGTASAQLSDLFTGPSMAWNFSPQITVPIFEGGRNRANLDVAKLSKEVEVAQYEKAIQTTFREVADALIVKTWIDEQMSAGQALVTAQQQRFTLADARYKRGVDSYLAVLTAQQDLYAAQQTLINVRFVRLANQVTLYRVLGGGWSEPKKD